MVGELNLSAKPEDKPVILIPIGITSYVIKGKSPSTLRFFYYSIVLVILRGENQRIKGIK
jgi:hypothetical protein